MEWIRLKAVIIKEFKQFTRDRRTLGLIIVQPILMMTIFGIAFGGEIRHLPVVVSNMDKSIYSWRVTHKIEQSEILDVVSYLDGYENAKELVKKGEVRGAIVIPKTFAETLTNEKKAKIIVITDGSYPTFSEMIIGEVQKIAAEISEELTKELASSTSISVSSNNVQIKTYSIVAYGANLRNIDFTTPGVMGLVIQMLTMILTGISVVREKEVGTIENIVASPLQGVEFIFGKIITYLVVAIVITTNVICVAIFGFGVVVRGSLLDVFLVSILFALGTMCLGILFSTVSRNQLQAVQTTIITFLPSILFSGFFFPVESFPRIISWLPYFIPLYYYIEAMRGIMLKGWGLAQVTNQLIALSIFTGGSVLLTTRVFAKKLD